MVLVKDTINLLHLAQVVDQDLIMQDLVAQVVQVERLVLLGQVDQQAVMEADHQLAFQPQHPQMDQVEALVEHLVNQYKVLVM